MSLTPYESEAVIASSGDMTLLTARDVGERLNVSTETVLRWTRRGTLPGFRLPGGALRYQEAELAEWLAERATPGREVSSNPTSAASRVRYLASSNPEDEE